MASKLVQITPHQSQNPTDNLLRQSFDNLQSKLKPPFKLPYPTPEEYTQLNSALLYGILTDPHMAKTRHIKHLHAIVTDGYGVFVSLVVRVVNELFPQLVDLVKDQLIWVTGQLIGVSAVGIDGLFVSFLRQIVAGDFSGGNLRLCSELLSMFLENWDWVVEEEPLVLPSAVFTYLRVLGDHCKISNNAGLESLKKREIGFCVRVLREQFHLCLQIGRDLVRHLQDLAFVPEFRDVWKDLMVNPGALRTDGFSNISQIYLTRTSSRHFLLRITPEMETQLRFLLTHVKFGSQKRYQAWFVRKFLCEPDRETVICDIVRFICCAHHPSNEIIQSDVIQRWAVIGWLLSLCRRNYVAANAKLALFYDWLFFDERVDNIMNIEPAMLLMVHSIPQYIDFTHTLLDFLLLLVDNYDVERNHIISRGVLSAFSLLAKKGVVHSLEVLTSCNKLSPPLKERLVIFLKGGVPNDLLPHDPDHSDSPLSLLDGSHMELDKPAKRRKRSLLINDSHQGALMVFSTIGTAKEVT